jgi:hypothetical protein
MKLYTFKGQHKVYGQWQDDKLSDGTPVSITLTSNDGALLNKSCKPNYRWIGPIKEGQEG